MAVRHVTSNNSGTKLTRPKPMWKRVCIFIVGLLIFLVGLSHLTAEPIWMALLAMFFGGCGIVVAVTEKTETLG